MRKVWNSGMASMTCTEGAPSSGVPDAGVWEDASAGDRPSSTPFTEDEGYFAEWSSIFRAAFLSTVQTILAPHSDDAASCEVLLRHSYVSSPLLMHYILYRRDSLSLREQVQALHVRAHAGTCQC